MPAASRQRGESASVQEANNADPLARIAAARERNIRFVELQFTDLLGIVKGVTIPLHQLEGSLNHGTWFDGSSIEGFTRIAESDQFLKPDMDTFAEIPWKPGSGDLGAGPFGNRGTARVICDVYTPDGKAFVGDPRGVLKRQLARAAALGYIWNAGPELEFFLFRKDEHGLIKPLPHDNAGYFDFSTDLGSEIRQDMVHALEAFGISVEAAHHEVAAGQHEIDFRYADGLKTADNAVTFKFTLKAIAQLHDLYATFMPKPIFGINGSGMHVHQSLFSVAEQRNVIRRPQQPVRPLDHRPAVHGRHPRPRPGHDRRACTTGELVQAAGARLRGAHLPDLGAHQPLGAHPRAQGLARRQRRGHPCRGALPGSRPRTPTWPSRPCWRPASTASRRAWSWPTRSRRASTRCHPSASASAASRSCRGPSAKPSTRSRRMRSSAPRWVTTC